MFISKTRRIQPTDNKDKGQQEIEKEPDLTNPENFPECIQLFIHLLTKRNLKSYLNGENQTIKLT